MKLSKNGGEKMSKYRDVIGGCVFFIFAAVYYWLAFSIRETTAGSVLGSAFMPKMYGIIMMVLCAIQILNGVRTVKKAEVTGEGEKKKELTIKQQLYSLLESFGLLVIYVVLLDAVGFVIMSALFVFFMTIVLLPKKGRSKNLFVKVGIISIVFSVAVYLVFVQGFALTLPAGILG